MGLGKNKSHNFVTCLVSIFGISSVLSWFYLEFGSLHGPETRIKIQKLQSKLELFAQTKTVATQDSPL